MCLRKGFCIFDGRQAIPPPRLQDFLASLPPDQAVLTVDLGITQILFNGCVPKDERIIQGFNGMHRYCYCCANTGRDSRYEVTREFLQGSLELEYWEPVGPQHYPKRMVPWMRPDNTVPCQMHDQMRSPPAMLCLIWLTLYGTPLSAHPAPAADPSTRYPPFDFKNVGKVP